MKQVINHRDPEERLRQDQEVCPLPEGASLAPPSRECLQDLDSPNQPLARTATAAGVSQPRDSISSRSSDQELEAFFHSPDVEEQKRAICDIGHRMWQRSYVDGNGGNLAVKVAEDLVLCTPTLISKGFMKPEDLCLVDLAGRQLAGTKKRTSEVLLHLQMMKRQPRVLATLHCHAPCATGFGLAGIRPPNGLISEFELTNSVAVAPYRTPGSPELGQLIAELVEDHNTILMANHGVVTWSPSGIEDAYFKVEVLEGYCHALLVCAHVGRPAHTLTGAQMKDLLRIKLSLGIPDPRYGLSEGELDCSAAWPPHGSPIGSSQGERRADSDPETEALVRSIAEQVLARLRR